MLPGAPLKPCASAAHRRPVMFAHIIDACTLVAVGPRAADHTINLVPLTFFHSWEDPRLKSQSCSRRIYIASAFPWPSSVRQSLLVPRLQMETICVCGRATQLSARRWRRWAPSSFARASSMTEEQAT